MALRTTAKRQLEHTAITACAVGGIAAALQIGDHEERHRIEPDAIGLGADDVAILRGISARAGASTTTNKAMTSIRSMPPSCGHASGVNPVLASSSVVVACCT